MKKIIFWIIVIGLIYYYRNTIANWPIVQAILQNPIVANVVNKAENQIQDTLTKETVTRELQTWVFQDGVKLPKDWILGEKTFGLQKVLVIVPPNPQEANDFIVLGIEKQNIPTLPDPHTCKETQTTATCLVGNNYETLKTFSILTFAK